MELLKKYEDDYKNLNNINNINNVYNLEDYRRKKQNRMPDNIIKYSLTHDLVWSETDQDYIKTPRDAPLDDEG